MPASEPKFQLTIDPPRAGWIDVAVSCGNEVHRFDPSYINDAIGAMVLAAAGLAERQCGWGGDTRFDWHAEPGVWRWRLTPQQAEVSLLVQYLPECFPGPSATGTVILETIVPGRRFCNAVLRAMDTLVTQITPDGYEEEWGHPFPSAAIERLRTAVKAWE